MVFFGAGAETRLPGLGTPVLGHHLFAGNGCGQGALCHQPPPSEELAGADTVAAVISDTLMSGRDVSSTIRTFFSGGQRLRR